MAKKEPAPLRAVTAYVRGDVHAAAVRCAALHDPPLTVKAWFARIIEQEARCELEGHGLPWPRREEA